MSLPVVTETSPSLAAPPCRVCGQELLSKHQHCPQCGIPARSPLPNPLDVTWVDVVFATLAAMTSLAISLPATVWLAQDLWKGPFGGGEIVALAAISSLNGWMIGVPLWVTAWRWRDRICDDDLYHGIALRDYWQTQALCLIPPTIIIIPILTASVWMNFF